MNATKYTVWDIAAKYVLAVEEDDQLQENALKEIEIALNKFR